MLQAGNGTTFGAMNPFSSSTSGWRRIILGVQQSGHNVTFIVERTVIGSWSMFFQLALVSYGYMFSGEIKIWSLSASAFNSDDFVNQYYYTTYQGMGLSYFPSTLIYYLPPNMKGYSLSCTSTLKLYSNTVNTGTYIYVYQAHCNNIVGVQYFQYQCVSGLNPGDYGVTPYITMCQPYYYTNGLYGSGSCAQCNTYCTACSTSATHCYACNTAGYSTVTFSSLTHYCSMPCTSSAQINVNGVCVSCSTPCLTCTGTANLCTYCITGYNYVNDGSHKCVQNTTACPTGTYLVSGYRICQPCTDPCATCDPTNPTTCYTCDSGYILYGTTCILQCPDQSVYDTVSGTCLPCDTNCQSCTSLYTNCTYCLSGYYLDTSSNTCGTSCSPGYYPDAQSRVCMICQPGCARCDIGNTANNYTCTSCNTGYYLLGSNCVTSCPYMNYYANTASATCDACNPACTICITSINDCLECQAGYLYNGGACINNCPTATYMSGGACYPCDPSCQDCYGSINTQCTKCTSGNFLDINTCNPSCPGGLFADTPSRTCIICAYYCQTCTSPALCSLCYPGYDQVGATCQGEYFVYIEAGYNYSVPVNPAYQAAAGYDVNQSTIELWFNADDMTTSYTEIILGTAPYKLRKKAGVSRLQIMYKDTMSYCDSTVDLNSQEWYHFAFTLSENPADMQCYLNGVNYTIGTNPLSSITNSIDNLKEITFGYTNYLSLYGSEYQFSGYIKEFRYWNVTRTPFQVLNFMNIALTSKPASLLIYYKLDEINDGSATEWIDYSSGGSIYYNPLTSTPSFALSTTVQMREIYLLLCPEGYYVGWDTNLGYYVCTVCDSGCQNCIGAASNNCTSCNSPYKLLYQEYQCITVKACPGGYYLSPTDGLCYNCFDYCSTCSGSATQCSTCKPQYFYEYLGTSCVDTCPTGMYGNYRTQQCYFDPVIKSVSPADGSIFSYGDFIDMIGSFSLKNNEKNTTYYYGWTVFRQQDNMDLSLDAFKTYYGGDMLKVHLDKNVILPNYNYELTFYVQGYDTYYNNFYASLTHVIYVGVPPKSGVCESNIQTGYPVIQTFIFNQSGWVDENEIIAYNFYYSYDDGTTYIPLTNANGDTSTSISVVFNPIYQNTRTLIKCEVENSVSFTSYVTTSIYLLRRDVEDPDTDLGKVDLSTLSVEADYLQMAQSLSLMAQSLGNLNASVQTSFDPRSELSQCSNASCNNNGTCTYLPLRKKNYCTCTGLYGGVNCTFANKTNATTIQYLVSNLTLDYSTNITNPLYQIQFLSLITTYIDMINIWTVSYATAIIDSLVQSWGAYAQDASTIQNLLDVISNLMEFQEYLIIQNNVTNQWAHSNASLLMSQNNIATLLSQIESIQANSLQQVTAVDTEYQYVTKMVAFKQIRVSQDSVLSVVASNQSLASRQTYIKISTNNFVNMTTPMDYYYIIQATEYALNPYEIYNNQSNPFSIGTNVFETDLFNSSNYQRLAIDSVTTPFDIYFPLYQNYNLTLFAAAYNALNPLKLSDSVQRATYLADSKLNCTYWDGNEWNNTGCQFKQIDTTHVRCQCYHLTTFGPWFIYPDLVTSQTTTQAAIKTSQQASVYGNITLVDLFVPIDQYFSNLASLFKHQRPKPISFFFKPGMYVVLAYWALYLSGLVYYTGKDKVKRYNMTKSQNREDLCEIRDNKIQNLDQVIRDLILRDNALNAESKPEEVKDKARLIEGEDHKGPVLFEDMSKEQKRSYKKKARKKYFGRVGSVHERAQKFYYKTLKKDPQDQKTKMKFFYEELKNNLFLGLIAKTSKIAPRHARLTLMYFTACLYLLFTSLIMTFGVVYYISVESMFQIAALSLATILGIMPFQIIMAQLLRMPMNLRRQVEGIQTKKLNKAFKVIDEQMDVRYSIAYFIHLLFSLIMSAVVIFFNYFYPSSYCLQWFFTVVIIFFLDQVIFTMGFAALQLFTAIGGQKVKCIYHIWAFFEIFRYIKNLRG